MDQIYLEPTDIIDSDSKPIIEHARDRNRRTVLLYSPGFYHYKDGTAL